MYADFASGKPFNATSLPGWLCELLGQVFAEHQVRHED
jgi:hypothetical protein